MGADNMFDTTGFHKKHTQTHGQMNLSSIPTKATTSFYAPVYFW